MTTYSDSITDLNVSLIPTRMVSESLGVSFDVILLECAFKINPVSVRSFKGCNVAWFTFFRKIDFRLKNYLVPTPFIMFSGPKLS